MSPQPPDAGTARSFLSFDHSLRRTGVATGNSITGAAAPLRTLTGDEGARLQAIGRMIDEWRPDGLVVGVPCHPDGAPDENTQRARRFARRLRGRFGLPVQEVDERYTTTEARAAGAADLDAAAAALILEQYLREDRAAP